MVHMLLMILYLITIGLSAYSCGWLLLRAERNGTTGALAACQLLVILWCVPQLFMMGYLAGYASDGAGGGGLPITKGMQYLGYGISYLGISFIGPAWLVFSFLYCRQRLPGWLKGLLFGLPMFHYLAFLTNEYHHLFYREFEVGSVVYGWVFYEHMIYTYLCVLGGLAVVLREFQKQRVFVVHLLVILLAAAVPLGFNILYLSGWLEVSFDLTPSAFALSSFLMLLAVLRYDFLDVNALAFGQIFSSIAEGVAVYNKRGIVVYCNEAAFGWLGIRAGDDFEKIRVQLASQGITAERERELLAEEAEFVPQAGGRIRVRQYLKRSRGGSLVAGTFLLTDVGEYYERLQQSRELAVAAQRLAIEKERNRIAQEVHDTTGHTLTMIQSLLRLARVEWEQAGNSEPVLEESRPGTEGGSFRTAGAISEYLTQAQELAVNGIRELRISINQLRQGTDWDLVTQGICQLAKSVKELEVEVDIQGEDGPGYSHLSMIVYECFREAITNCLKYARATHMDAIVKFEEKGISLYIFDNGQGCREVVENNGIRGIRERVENAGGRVRILSSEGEGFQIYIWLPAGKG